MLTVSPNRSFAKKLLMAALAAHQHLERYYTAKKLLALQNTSQKIEKIKMVVTKGIKLRTKGETDIIDITDKVNDCIVSSKVKDGIVTVFVPGSTGGLTTVEYESGLVEDLNNAFEIVAPRRGEYHHNLRWHDGNGFSHVRAAVLGPSLTVPFSAKRMHLGTWQQIVFIDFDNRPRSRELIVQIIGE